MGRSYKALRVIKMVFLTAKIAKNKLASLEATLVRNYDPATYLLTGVRCRATSVAKKKSTAGTGNDREDLWK